MSNYTLPKPLARTLAAVATAGLASAAIFAGGPAQAASDPIITINPTVGAPSKPSGPPVAPFGFALTSAGEITTFSLANPSQSEAKKITGVPAGSTIVGIDERPKTGDLYAVVKAANGAGSAYIITPSTGAATKAFDLVSISGVVPGNTGPTLLTGSRFGVDFNPSADALRITSDSGLNLRALPSDRIAPAGGIQRTAGDTFTDKTLNYAGVTATGIEASAYTNNVATTGGPTALYNIDSVLSQLTLQNPPNDGVQVKVADVALDGRPVSGFDISGSTTAYLATANNIMKATPANPLESLLVALKLAKPRPFTVVNLSTVDLTTGALTSVGNFFNNTVIDIAVDTPAP